jgi:predicted ester cyclase
MNNKNKEIGRRWFEDMWNKADNNVVEELVDKNYNPEWVQMDMTGPNLIKHEIKYFRSIFPDLKYQIIELVSQQRKVWIRYKAIGTHLGIAWGFKPTKKEIEFEGISILHINQEGKIVDQWGMFCFYDIFEKLGLVPPYWDLSKFFKQKENEEK